MQEYFTKICIIDFIKKSFFLKRKLKFLTKFYLILVCFSPRGSHEVQDDLHEGIKHITKFYLQD